MTRNTNRRKNKSNFVGSKHQTPVGKGLGSLSTEKTEVSIEDVQKQLEDEFCPPLDSALVAAILADRSEYNIEPLRDDLRLLSINAWDTLDISPSSIANPVSADTTGGSSHSGVVINSSVTSRTAASRSQVQGDQSSATSGTSFTSPFGFLTSLFPHTPPKYIETALASTGWVKSPEDDAELNMDAVVNTILSEEFINDNMERGYVLGGGEGEPAENESSNRRPEQSWGFVQKTKKVASSGNVDTNGLGPRQGKRIKPITTSKTVSVPLFDVRQRQHLPPARPRSAPALPPPDPWVHLASLATQLHHLLPNTSYAQFLALFHNPTHATPVAALRTHLSQLSAQPGANISERDIDMLTELVPILDNYEMRVRADVVRDAAICLGATFGRKEDAYDLMTLLRDLDVNGAVIYHSVPVGRINTQPPSSSGPISPPSASVSSSTSQSMFPRAQIAPFLSTPKSPSHQLLNTNSAANTSAAWQKVNRRADASSEHQGQRCPRDAVEARNLGSHKKALKHDDAAMCRERAEEYRIKREEALRQASSHWQRGKLGGEIALFYAEEARKLDADRRQWGARGAKAQVLKSMRTDRNGDCSIDLHGLTVNEGVIVTKEALDHWRSSNWSGRTMSSTFTIITGVGRHSSGSIGVLGPAVYKALEEDGWHVGKEHGKLVVSGGQRG